MKWEIIYFLLVPVMKTNTGLPFVTYIQNNFKVGYLIFCGTELFFFCVLKQQLGTNGGN